MPDGMDMAPSFFSMIKVQILNKKSNCREFEVDVISDIATADMQNKYLAFYQNALKWRCMLSA